MSVGLIPIGYGKNIPVKYRPINMTGTVTSTFAYEHNRILYICLMLTDISKCRFQKINLLTNELVLIADIPLSSFGNTNIGNMIVDDNYIYIISYNATVYMYRIKIDTLVVDQITMPIPHSPVGCMGMMYDNKTIAIACDNCNLFFNTSTGECYNERDMPNNIGRYGYAVGKKLILTAPNSNTLTYVDAYRIEANTTYSITGLPVASATSVCYGDGKFYMTQVNRLIVYDEDTETVESVRVVPWTKTKDVKYTDGILFVMCADSNILYIYNISTNMYKTIILPWTIPNMNSSSVNIPCAFSGYYFLPYQTLCMVDYTEDSKYKLGHVFDQYIFILNETESSKYVYDNRFVEFKSSHLTIHDGELSYQTEDVDINNHIKKISVNKSDYGKIKSISYINKPLP